MPEFVKTLTEQVVGFGADPVTEAELAGLQQLMRANFPLCAFAFSTLYGPRFAAILNGDGLTQSALFEALERFQQVNVCLMALGGRLSLKLFGKSLLSFNASAATGSLFIVASTAERSNALRRWVESKPLQSDTIVNQLKERLTRWQFWAKALVGVVEYKPHQLRQEVIVLDASSGEATSSVAPRIPFEFGFSLSEVACSPEELAGLTSQSASAPAPAQRPLTGADEDLLASVEQALGEGKPGGERRPSNQPAPVNPADSEILRQLDDLYQ
jgi:hypothetical protein